MRIKMFFLFLLPFLVFGGDCKFKLGDRFVYEMQYYRSENSKISYQMIYDVVSINVDGSVTISCSHQGDAPNWVSSALLRKS